MSTARYALIDNYSRFLWWIGEAPTPEAACAAATLEYSMEVRSYQRVDALNSNDDAYLVYEAPAGLVIPEDDDIADAVVSALPLVGRYKACPKEESHV